MSAAVASHAEHAHSERPHFSPVRVASGVVLTAWAAGLWFVFLAGRSNFFLSTRTDWVIPAGAVLVSAAAIGRLWTMRTPDTERISRREGVIMGLFLLPVVLIVVLPQQSLSSFAVSRRPAFATGVAGPGTEAGSGSLTMLQVAGAQTTRRGLEELAAHAGEHVSYTGFVTRTPTTPADEFALNRFVISCCVADAQSAYIRVVDAPPGKFDVDEWVTVDGTVYPIGRTVILQADKIVSVPKPTQPYLTP